MRFLMITWTDIFYGIGSFFQWCFKGIRALGQFPNVVLGAIIIFLLAYWCIKITQQKRKAVQDGTYQ